MGNNTIVNKDNKCYEFIVNLNAFKFETKLIRRKQVCLKAQRKL